MAHAKAGVVGGLALLALASVRLFDDCGRVANRGVRFVDDIPMGNRTIPPTSVDEMLPTSLVDEVAAGGQLAVHARSLPAAAPTTKEELAEALGELGVDVSTQFIVWTEDDEEPPLLEDSPPRPLKCPAVVDLSLVSAGWSQFLDGFGSACAPRFFVGDANASRTMLVQGEPRSVTRMAKACAELGSVCVFVGCEPGARACFEAANAAVVRPTIGMSVDAFVGQFVLELATANNFLFVAAMTAEGLMLVEPHPARDRSLRAP